MRPERNGTFLGCSVFTRRLTDSSAVNPPTTLDLSGSLFLPVCLLMSKLAQDPQQSMNVSFIWVTVRHLTATFCIATSGLRNTSYCDGTNRFSRHERSYCVSNDGLRIPPSKWTNCGEAAQNRFHWMACCLFMRRLPYVNSQNPLLFMCYPGRISAGAVTIFLLVWCLCTYFIHKPSRHVNSLRRFQPQTK